MYYKNRLSKRVRQSAPDYEFDEQNFEYQNDTTYFAYF